MNVTKTVAPNAPNRPRKRGASLKIPTTTQFHFIRNEKKKASSNRMATAWFPSPQNAKREPFEPDKTICSPSAGFHPPTEDYSVPESKPRAARGETAKRNENDRLYARRGASVRTGLLRDGCPLEMCRSNDRSGPAAARRLHHPAPRGYARPHPNRQPRWGRRRRPRGRRWCRLCHCCWVEARWPRRGR